MYECGWCKILSCLSLCKVPKERQKAKKKDRERGGKEILSSCWMRALLPTSLFCFHSSRSLFSLYFNLHLDNLPSSSSFRLTLPSRDQTKHTPQYSRYAGNNIFFHFYAHFSFFLSSILSSHSRGSNAQKSVSNWFKAATQHSDEQLFYALFFASALSLPVVEREREGERTFFFIPLALSDCSIPTPPSSPCPAQPSTFFLGTLHYVSLIFSFLSRSLFFLTRGCVEGDRKRQGGGDVKRENKRGGGDHFRRAQTTKKGSAFPLIFFLYFFFWSFCGIGTDT